MKQIIGAIIVGVIIIGGAIIFSSKNNSGEINKLPQKVVEEKSNVIIENGVQVVNLNVKGGYQPKNSIAKAGIPTVVRFNTKNTFDCSSSIVIPSLKISKLLPQTGSTDIDVGIQQIGKLSGSCGMGMYGFTIDFQ